MAHGACSACGCAFEECARDGCPGTPKRQPKKPQPMLMTNGDWVRVKPGHTLAGAAGAVKHIDRTHTPALVRFRQLNGNELRLPLGLLEFVSYAGYEPDVL